MYLRVLWPAAWRRDCYYLGDLGLTCWVNLDRTLQLSVLLLPYLLYANIITLTPTNGKKIHQAVLYLHLLLLFHSVF